MWNNMLLILIALSFGFLSSAGVFTVLITIGLIPRFAKKTRTTKHILLYEEASTLGTIVGGIYSLFPFSIRPDSSALQLILLIIYGTFTGIFIGCLALAIAEMLNAIPIFTRRLRFHHGLRTVIYSMALGKLIGSLVYFYYSMGILSS